MIWEEQPTPEPEPDPDPMTPNFDPATSWWHLWDIQPVEFRPPA